MRFVWFWIFWHWSRESFRIGSLLRGPLHGIGGHWDEWYRHEVCEADRNAIDEAGRTEASQRQFIRWLIRDWARDLNCREYRQLARFVLGQLAPLPPFSRWVSFEKYREGYGVGGVSAIVLEEKSPGEAKDIRSVEALFLPADADPSAPSVVSEGFHADAAELDGPHQAAASLLRGKGLFVFLGLWVSGGKRPYPRWLQITLAAGWLAVSGAIAYLRWGPDPSEGLAILYTGLLAIWGLLVLTAAGVAGMGSFMAWKAGKNWASRLERSQVRLRMNGGLTLKGGSAGLPFCLNILLSLYRANPRLARHAWLWQRFFRGLRSAANSSAATGIVTVDGYLRPVVIEPKLRACLHASRIRRIWTPFQAGAASRVIGRLSDTLVPSSDSKQGARTARTARLGFAAERKSLKSHRCHHAGQVMMLMGGFTSRWQMALNAFALAVSVVMLAALPDVWSVLQPPPVPSVIAPSSPSPYYLWVSLSARHPEYFRVQLESRYWSNRRAEVKRYSGANASVRAEIGLQRLAGPGGTDEDDGIVWVERRRSFLGREFAPGERVGCYSLSYLTRLEHE